MITNINIQKHIRHYYKTKSWVLTTLTYCTKYIIAKIVSSQTRTAKCSSSLPIWTQMIRTWHHQLNCQLILAVALSKNLLEIIKTKKHRHSILNLLCSNSRRVPPIVAPRLLWKIKCFLPILIFHHIIQVFKRHSRWRWIKRAVSSEICFRNLQNKRIQLIHSFGEQNLDSNRFKIHIRPYWVRTKFLHPLRLVQLIVPSRLRKITSSGLMKMK